MADTYKILCGHDAENGRIFFEVLDENGTVHPEFGRMTMLSADIINILKSAGNITALDGAHMPYEIKFVEVSGVDSQCDQFFQIILAGGPYKKI